MSILEKMGIQQWRLRARPTINPAARIVPEALASNFANVSDASEQGVSEQAVNDTRVKQNSQPSAEPENRPHQANPVAPVAVTPLSKDTPLGEQEATVPESDPIESLDWLGLQHLIDGQSQCQSCGSNRSILGAGDANADWMFICDAPISADLASQQLYSGRAGLLFEAILSALDLERSSVYSTSVFKCVTSDDLSVTPNCDKILHRQIELVQPEVIVVFGEFAAQAVAKANESLDVLRQKHLTCFRTNVPIITSFTPAQMLDEPSLKALVWKDLKKAIAISKA